MSRLGILASMLIQICSFSCPRPGSRMPRKADAVGPPFLGYGFETPASLACVYQFVPDTSGSGCNPNVVLTNPSGGTKAIAIVDAFDNPTAQADLNKFTKQFGLPHATVHVVYAQGAQPAQDPTGGWEIEESLDVQYAHAMAPSAEIYLVEAADNSDVNLFEAVGLASYLVSRKGGGEVSISWGGSEFDGETDYDSTLNYPNVVYVAAAGDSPGVIYPATSPYVIAAGGTSLSRSLQTGGFFAETVWQSTGGGYSLYEPAPPFQQSLLPKKAPRSVPDISFDSNPTSGVWVYDSNAAIGTSWYIVGGTSVAAPSLAGIINTAGAFAASSEAENAMIYANLGDHSTLRDITYGNCGPYNSIFATTGYDQCSGVGTPLGYKGK